MTLADRFPVGKVVTVTGPVEPVDLGRVMMHEHVLKESRDWHSPPADGFEHRAAAAEGPVTIEKLDALRRDPLINRDNLILDDDDLAVAELALLHAAGGGALLEMSTVGLGGRRASLPGISERSEIKIVAGAGFYTEIALPQDVRDADEDAIHERLLTELTREGVAAGAIGEMGTSDPLTPGEAMRLRVGATVAAELGLSLHIHLHPGGRDRMKAAEIALEHLSPDRVVLGHMDYERDPDRGYIDALAQTGATLSLDTFGIEHEIDSFDLIEPRDAERVDLLLWLVEQGYGDRLVVSNDVGFKTMLRAYGGFGYDHFLRDIAPQLRRRGLGLEILEQMLISTPQRVLATKR